MTRAIFFLVLGIITRMCVCQHNWTECEPGDRTHHILIHGLSISPDTIRLPGRYNVTFDGTVLRYVDYMVIDVQLGTRNETSGEIDHVFPKDSPYMRVYDGCKIIDKLLFGPPEVMRDIDVQIDRLFLAAVGYHAGCPLLEGRLTATQEIVLPANVMPFNSLPGASYVLNILFRSDTGDVVGCVNTDVKYRGHIIE